MTRHTYRCMYHAPRVTVAGGEPVSHGICTRHLTALYARLTLQDAYRFGVGSVLRFLTTAGWVALASAGLGVGVTIGLLLGWPE